MGQKVNPVGFRIGINHDWNSRWYATDKEFAGFLHEDIAIRKYCESKLKDCGLSHVEIERVKTDKGRSVNVYIFVSKVGVLLGQDGARHKQLKKDLEKLVKTGTLDVRAVEIKQPDLDANLVAQSIATQLEERASFRSVQKKAIQRVRKAGAKGCKTAISGRLAGAEIARSEGYREGVIPLHTLRSDIDYAIAEAHTTYGRLGCKVWICKGEKLPGQFGKAVEEKEEAAKRLKSDKKGE